MSLKAQRNVLNNKVSLPLKTNIIHRPSIVRSSPKPIQTARPAQVGCGTCKRKKGNRN